MEGLRRAGRGRQAVDGWEQYGSGSFSFRRGNAFCVRQDARPQAPETGNSLPGCASERGNGELNDPEYGWYQQGIRTDTANERFIQDLWVNLGGRYVERSDLNSLLIVDSHLDLAENVTLFGRDLTLRASEIRAVEKRASKQATVSLPDLERGGVAVAFATVTPGFLAADVGPDFEPRSALYTTPEEAEAQALTQMALYEAWERQGRVRLLKSTLDLEHHRSYGNTIASPVSSCSWKARIPLSTFAICHAGGGAGSGSSGLPLAIRAMAAGFAEAAPPSSREGSPRKAFACSIRWRSGALAGIFPI